MSRDKASATGRQERLAAALRDNLRRRKQARKPAADGAPGEAPENSSADPAGIGETGTDGHETTGGGRAR